MSLTILKGQLKFKSSVSSSLKSLNSYKISGFVKLKFSLSSNDNQNIKIQIKWILKNKLVFIVEKK